MLAKCMQDNDCIFVLFISIFHMIRHLRGEEVDALSIRELQGLEIQLDTALKRTRSRKVLHLYPTKNIILYLYTFMDHLYTNMYV